MNTLENNDTRGTSQDTLNLRPLGNRLGHNGPYVGGTGTKVERDCDRIDGHTTLFRDLNRFELDLRDAIFLVWDQVTDLHTAHQRVSDGTGSFKDALDIAVDGLNMAFKFMQESYLVAEVLDDRAKERERNRKIRTLSELIGDRPRECLSGLERLAEESWLEFVISTALDRMNAIRGVERREWPEIDRDALQRFNIRLLKLITPPDAEKLQAMSDLELAEELRTLEARIRDTRKAINLVHAVKTLREGSSDA